MRILTYFTFFSGIFLLLSAVLRARRGEDVVEVTAFVLVGIGVTVMGVDGITNESIPRWIHTVATMLLLLGGVLFMGLPKYRKQA